MRISLQVPVQRVTKYPLLLARLLKATPSGRPEMQELKKRLKQAQTNIELHLEHMNAVSILDDTVRYSKSQLVVYLK